jgi:PIN domain
VARLRIYLDTNILLRENWPRPGAKLRSLLTLARALQFDVAIPEAVEREVKAHWFRALDEQRGKLEAARDSLLKQLSKIKADDDLQLYDWDPDSLETRYGRCVEAVQSEFPLLSAPMTPVSLYDCFDLAIAHQPPFDDTGKGFQDTVILLSIMGDLIASPDTAGVLVSEDKIFHQESVKTRVRKNSLDLSIYTSIDDLFKKFLNSRMIEHVRRDWDEDARTVAASLYKQREEVQDFVRDTLSREPAELRPYFRKEAFEVRSAVFQEVDAVFTPQPRESQAESATIQIAASIRFLVRIGPPKGATSVEAFSFGEDLQAPVPIELEAEAVRGTSGYEVKKVIKARPLFEPQV